MQKPALVIMAAGIGSRFGGLKQIQPVDDQGHAIIDFSLFDARRAGFEKVVFIIKHAIEDDFKDAVGRRMEKYFDVRYVYQELDKLPEGYSVPDGRVKPWGTAHAVLCAADEVDGPFAVINSDDFYGKTAIPRYMITSPKAKARTSTPWWATFCATPSRKTAMSPGASAARKTASSPASPSARTLKSAAATPPIPRTGKIISPCPAA
jgi:choline kinase